MIRLATNAMGTRFEFVLNGSNGAGLRALGEELVREVEHWHGRLSVFQPDSFVSFINREASRRAVRLEPELFELLLMCRRVRESSDGAFDVTVGTHKQVWEHGCVGGGGGSVELDGESCSVRFHAEGVRLDFGGVAKGFALDRAAALLHEHGVGLALLHGGTSSVLGIGAPPGQDGWGVMIRGEGVSKRIVLRGTALGVSAPRGRVFVQEGGPTGHLMDGRTGRPVPLGITAAAVCASGAEADAWSTALAVLGTRPTGMPAEVGSLVHRAGEDWVCERREGAESGTVSAGG